jgi:hypothetical protein
MKIAISVIAATAAVVVSVGCGAIAEGCSGDSFSGANSPECAVRDAVDECSHKEGVTIRNLETKVVDRDGDFARVRFSLERREKFESTWESVERTVDSAKVHDGLIDGWTLDIAYTFTACKAPSNIDF